VIEHTVCFSLVHPEGSPAEREFLTGARELLTGVPGVQDFAVSRQVSPQSAFRFRFAMRFADEAAYRAYDAHPDHRRFVEQRWAAEVADFQEFDFTAW
jgi:hypothetical protein